MRANELRAKLERDQPVFGPVILELAVNGATLLDLLRAAVALVEGLGRVPATTARARRILGVPSATKFPRAFGS